MYQQIMNLVEPAGGLLMLVLPSIIFLCLRWREEKLGLLAWPFGASVILSTVIYRFGLEHTTFEAAPVLLVSGIVTIVVWYSWRHPELREHTIPMSCAVALGVTLYHIGSRVGELPGGTLTGATLGFGLVIFVICAFHSVINRTFNDFFGGLLVDLVFSDGTFGDKHPERKKLPNVGLLRHWRTYGMSRQAYRTARKHLAESEQTYPLWLFAAETAALYNDFPTAEQLVSQLYSSDAFSRDHKHFALLKLKEWAKTAHHDLDVEAFPIIPDRPETPRPLHEAHQLREQGRITDAEMKLRRLLDREPDHLAATLLLMRIYAQDQHRPKKADKLLRALEARKSAPDEFIEFAWRLLGEWTPPAAAPAPSWIARLTGRRSETRFRTRDSISTSEVLQAADDRNKSVADLLADGRLESALEKAQHRIATHPNDFKAWLQLLEIQTLYVGSLKRAGETYFKIISHPKFTKAQKEQAEKLVGRNWRDHYQPAVRLR